MARPSTPELSISAIAAAALELVDAHGEFTIPAMARAMDVSPSSLYNHAASKSDIIELMRGEAMGKVELPDPGADWVNTLRQIATGYMGSYARHPKLIPLLTAYTVRDAVTLRVYEMLADARATAGFGDDESLAAITVVDSFVLGSALDAAAPVQVWEAVEDAAGPWREALDAGLDIGDRAQRTFE